MKADICKHYNGMLVDVKCGAGVEYGKFISGKVPLLKSLPCFAKNQMDSCELRQFPTSEEIKQWDDIVDRSISRAVVALDAIWKHVGELKEGQGQRGEIECPICGAGQVHFTIADSNHHVHAQCTTSGCVSFIQ